MITLKRTLLLVLFLMSFAFTGYQIFLIVKPLFQTDHETYYVQLVDQYQVLKMKRLVLQEHYALRCAQIKMQQFARKTNSVAFNNLTMNATTNKTVVAPVALSFDQTKALEQLEVYVSTNKPKAKPALTQDERYILQSPADTFTLQLLGVRDIGELSQFVQNNKLQDARIVHTFYLNKDWYVLVTGTYKNHTEALKAIDALPDNIKSLKPWIRQVATLQKALQVY